MDKLEPCPFCGGEPGSNAVVGIMAGWMVGCFNPDCKINPAVHEFTETQAIAAWNRRPTNPRYGEAHSGLDAEQRHNRELSTRVEHLTPALCQRTLEAAAKVVIDQADKIDDGGPFYSKSGPWRDAADSILALGKDDR